VNQTRKEQEEASIVDAVLSAVTERLAGFTFTTEHEVDPGTDELIIHIKRVGIAKPCKVRIYLEV
jgi:hypothetical protein